MIAGGGQEGPRRAKRHLGLRRRRDRKGGQSLRPGWCPQERLGAQAADGEMEECGWR